MGSASTLGRRATVDLPREVGSLRIVLSFGLCCLVAFLDGLDSQAMAIAAPAFARSLHISPSALGFLFSFSLTGATAGAISGASMAGRWSTRNMLLASVLLLGIFQAASAFVVNYVELLAARFGAGVGLGAATTCFLELGASSLPQNRRTTLMSILWAFFPLGQLVGGIFNGWMVTAYGWQRLFVAGGILAFCVAALIYLYGRTRRSSPSIVRQHDPVVLRALGGDAQIRSPVLLLIVVYFGTFGTLAGIGAWLPSLLIAQGFTLLQSGQFLSWFSLGALGSMATAGALVRRFSTHVLTFGLLVAAGALALLSYSLADYWKVAGLMIGIGVFLGVAGSGAIAVAVLLLPEQMRSKGLGAMMAARYFGQILIPSPMGWYVGKGATPAAVLLMLAVAPGISAAAAAIMKISKVRTQAS